MNRRLVKSIFFAIFSFLSVITFASSSVFADAGPGYNPGGGSCRGGSVGTGWFDTCFGVSWQYYEYSGTENVKITGSDNAPGATIPAATCAAYGGFWHLGYERYIIGSSASQDHSSGQQRGTVRLGLVSGYGGYARFYEWGTPSSSFGGAKAVRYGSLDEVGKIFNGIEPQYKRGYTYAPGSDLGWFCGPPNAEVVNSFYSTSTVQGEGQSSTSSRDSKDGRIVINTNKSSVSLSFSHNVGRADESHNAASTNWSISGSGHTPKSPNSGTFNSTETVRSAKVDQDDGIVVNIGEGQSVEVCQTISYSPKNIGGNNSGSSKACAVISRKADTTTYSCPLPNSSYSINKGGTQALSGVRNLSSGDSWSETTETNHLVTVWAKPGDNIQFKHSLCFGAQAVRGANNPGGNGSSTPERTRIAAERNTVTIKAFTSPATGGANYLFGKTLTGSNSQTFSLEKGAAQPSAVSGADEKGDYYFTYYSPSQKSSNAAGSQYKCYAGSQGFDSFKSNSYQIPDFTASAKPSDCNAVAASDVGKVIEQDMDWNLVQAWISEYSSGGSSSCGCNNSNANGANISSANYNSSPSGEPGHHVIKCYSNGSCGCCGKYCTSCHTDYSTTDYWYYPTQTSSTSGPTKKAQVKVPYNYTTSTSTSVDNISGTVFGGEKTNATARVSINPRGDNPNVSGDYATISKPSTFEVVAFTVPSNVSSMPSKLNGSSNYSSSRSTPACSYYDVSGGSCQSIRREDTTFNASGYLSGSSESLLSLAMDIPDIEAGWKYCVAVGVFPSNSHNNENRPASNDPALSSDGSTWNYSKASCVTIAKKPNVQFRGAGVISSGGIRTSTSPKQNSPYIMRDSNSPCSFSGPSRANSGSCGASDLNAARRVFGSWSEYDLVAKKRVLNFASGAAFGYERNNGGNYALPGGYTGIDHKSEPDTCTFSSQTINNNECASKTVGLSTINSSAISLDRLMSRYTSPSAVTTQAPNTRLDLEGTCIARNGQYYPSRDGVNISTNTSYVCLENGAKYVKVNGNATVAGTSSAIQWYCMTKGNNENSRTSVIDVSGTLTIDANFVYGNLNGSNCGADTYNSIAELPQQLVFAKEINITGRVTNIDAWLIADKGQGNINTCSDYAQNNLSSDRCNNQLTINGPVFAGKLILSRTYGANPTNGSILPAKIFNLRDDAYLWAYNQAQRFSQSVTVYSTELAPRF